MNKVIIILALCFVFIGNVQALDTVKFYSQPGSHSAFKIKKAMAKGIKLTPKPPVELTGYLGIPNDVIDARAVILLHGDNGLKDYHKQWAAQLTEWGYISLLVYSFGAMGEQVPTSINVSGDVISNAYGAYEYLKKFSKSIL